MHKKIGKYIRKVNVRNVDLATTNLLGINIDKFFMPSVANVVGTDMSAYKIVKKRQFSCNRMHVGRDYRLPISLSTSDEDFLVSPAYDVFEVKNEEELLPEYLMMWFLRKEFDRNAWFYTDADVRGGLSWDVFCDIELPVPSIEKQKEIVKEYNVVKNRIELNNKLIQKLEETAQAIYKQWFVDFEFPGEDGKPYKSSGGEMEWCEELEKEVPKDWKCSELKNLATVYSGFAFSSDIYHESGSIGLVTIKNVQDGFFLPDCDNFLISIPKKTPEYCQLRSGDILMSLTGNVGRVAIVYGENYLLNQRVAKITPHLLNDFAFVYFYMRQKKFQDLLVSVAGGTAQQNLSPIVLSNTQILIPDKKILDIFGGKYNQFLIQITVLLQENTILKKTKDVFLSKIATFN